MTAIEPADRGATDDVAVDLGEQERRGHEAVREVGAFPVPLQHVDVRRERHAGVVPQREDDRTGRSRSWEVTGGPYGGIVAAAQRPTYGDAEH